MCKKYFKAEGYKAVSQYSLAFTSSINLVKILDHKSLVSNKNFESHLETRIQDSECLLYEAFLFIADIRKSGTWKHVWKTQAALLQWTRPNGNNTVAAGNSWGWGLPVFFILRACDKYVLLLFLMKSVTEQQLQTLHLVHCWASQQWPWAYPKQGASSCLTSTHHVPSPLVAPQMPLPCSQWMT